MKVIHQIIIGLFFCVSISTFGQAVKAESIVDATIYVQDLVVGASNLTFPTLKKTSNNNRYFMMDGTGQMYSSSSNDGLDENKVDFELTGSNPATITIDGLPDKNVNFEITTTGGSTAIDKYIELSNTDNDKIRFYPRMFEHNSQNTIAVDDQLVGTVTLDDLGELKITLAGNIRLESSSASGTYSGTISIDFSY